MNDLFLKTDSTECQDFFRHQMFISGEAGSGKTTLLNKITQDWAKKREDIKILLQFDFVFLVKLSQISTLKLSSFCLQQYFKKYFLSELSFNKIVQKKKVLFVLDGLDELNSNNQDLKNLLEGTLYQSSSFLVTSRPGVEYKGSFHNNFSIRGLSEKNVDYFLGQFRKVSNTASLLPHLNHPIRSLLKVPIFLWFYALLHEELSIDKHEALTRTQLYTLIVDALKKKCLNRVSAIKESDLLKASKSLSKKAYHCLCEDRLWNKNKYFEDSNTEELSRHTEEFRETTLGIIIKQRKTTNLTSESVFTLSHRTILEYVITHID